MALAHALSLNSAVGSLEKGDDGSKAFAINTHEQWDDKRPFLSGSLGNIHVHCGIIAIAMSTLQETTFLLNETVECSA